jgi:DinB superfamily
MKYRAVVALAVLVMFTLLSADVVAAPASAAAEYAQHFDALSDLSVAVAKAMPPDQYGFRPHPESMDFGQLMSHIATTNFQFCAGLKDADPPALPSPKDKGAVVKFLSDSFDYCAGVIPNLTDEQLSKYHNSPDGRLVGREILLAMYIHVAHHRGQAEIYLRDKGIRPPGYRI